MINIKKIDSNLLEINKKSYKDIGIYNIGYITVKRINDYESIYSVNPLYLIIAHASGYIEEKGVNKYLVFDSTDENKENKSTLTIRSVFEEDGKLYPQVFLDDTLYEFNI